MLRAAVLCSAALSATAVTPVEKVISLLAGLKQEVETEGQEEAKVYDKFACFCRDTTKLKSGSIVAGRDNIQSLSANIADTTASRKAKQGELKDRQENQEAMSKELSDTEALFAKDRATYEAEAADLSKAIRGLNNAIKAMSESTPASLLEVQHTLRESLGGLVELMDSADAKRSSIRSFLQVDPADPTYKYHSNGIIETLQGLLQEFSDDKVALDGDWAVTKKTYEDSIANMTLKISENSKAMDQLAVDIEELAESIANSRQGLVSAEAMLKDDQQYMKDLTKRCETRANDWDQRSQMRADELAALTKALDILQGKGQALDADVNERAAALLQRGTAVAAVAAAAAPVLPRRAVLVGVTEHAPPALLQMSAFGQLRGAASLRARQSKVVALLGQEGKRLGSVVLSQLAVAVGADPFAKVKTLIQNLVERLLAEATAEATKKGFCDEQLGRAHKDRDYRLRDTEKLDVQVQTLEIKLDELRAEIEELTGDIADLKDKLNIATDDRTAEHQENADTMKKAREGEAAITEAINTLKVFYKQAAKAAALVQASPVDEDTAGAGFEGAYQGKQESSKGIIGLLEVIKADFDRTFRKTEEAEQRSHEEFVEFDRASKADIGAKETKKALNEEDAETTKNTIASKMDDIKSNQALLDDALKRVEDLKPTCIDTGMSFDARVAKREEEIHALQNALCLLDTEQVEQDCFGEPQLS